MSTIKIDNVPIGSLKPNKWNTNIVTPENEEKIEASLNRFGFFRPLIVRTLPDDTLQILGGEHRWSVARRMGYTDVPVINLGKIDERRAKEISLVDNGRYGDDDALQLADLLKELGDVDELLNFLPYSGDEIDSIFSASSIALDELDIPDGDDDLPEPIAPTKAAQTHQIMRFKIPIEDSDFVQRVIENTMRSQGFTEDDSMSNAGNALVHIVRSLANAPV